MADLMTVLDALIVCGVDNDALFSEETQAQRIADDIFDNVFASCMDITFKELDDHFKTYSDLTVAQGQSGFALASGRTSRHLSNGLVTN